MTNGLTDQAHLDDLFGATYEELRRLAALLKRRHKSATLNPTALVHEAWIKLSGSDGIATVSELHFKRLAARVMRQVLIDSVRRRKTNKRGGAEDPAFTIQLSAQSAATVPLSVSDGELLALDDSLSKLTKMNARQAVVVECRFFGGLEMAEIAAFLEISEATVLRNWRAARAWLAQEVRGA